MAATTSSSNCSNFFIFRSNSTPKMRPSSSSHHGSCRGKVDGVGMWLINSVSAAFFASLERCSCIRIATHDDAADECNDLPLIYHDGNLERQFSGRRTSVILLQSRRTPTETASLSLSHTSKPLSFSLYFVFLAHFDLQSSEGSNDGDAPPYFVRRWAAKLDDLEVDWMRSFHLNSIAHTKFTVTVAICSNQDLRNHQAEQDKSLSPIYKVVKTVYASPSSVNFHLDSKKEVETSPAYPDICFAVDDFDSTFDSVVLTDTDHCYCVVLNAHDGAAFPTAKESDDCSSSDTSSSLKVDISSVKAKTPKLTLFSGFVSYQMVRDAYDVEKSRFGNLLSLAQSPGKQNRLYMKGPGGRGEVEVAVSGVTDQSQQDAGPFSPVSSKKGFGIGFMVRRAASVASVAANNAYAAASSTHSFDEEMIPLKCCLMSISLPWEDIAYDLLFKGTPPVNL